MEPPKFSEDFAREFEGRIARFLETDPSVSTACEELRHANVACGFTCNSCGTSPPNASIAYQCRQCAEFDVCAQCKATRTDFGNSGHEASHELVEVDIRFPPVIHGPDVLGFERFIFGAHTSSITAEELQRFNIPLDVNPFPFLLEQMMFYRSRDPDFQTLMKSRILRLITECTGVEDVPWDVLPTVQEHLDFDVKLGDSLNDHDFQTEINKLLDDERAGPPPERIRKIETMMCEREAEMCERRGFAPGYKGVVQLKAIALFLFETAIGSYHPQADGAGIRAGVAKAAIRERIGRKFFAVVPPPPPPGPPPPEQLDQR